MYTAVKQKQQQQQKDVVTNLAIFSETRWDTIEMRTAAAAGATAFSAQRSGELVRENRKIRELATGRFDHSGGHTGNLCGNWNAAFAKREFFSCKSTGKSPLSELNDKQNKNRNSNNKNYYFTKKGTLSLVSEGKNNNSYFFFVLATLICCCWITLLKVLILHLTWLSDLLLLMHSTLGQTISIISSLYLKFVVVLCRTVLYNVR